MSDLVSLRKKIDSLDTTIVNILNERARVSLDIGAAKKKNNQNEENVDNVQVYRPGREKEIYEKLTRMNAGPLNNESLHAIFREIMSASIALQKDVSMAYLGPPGTFSHQAAYNRLGDSVAYVPQKQIDLVFEAVEKGQTTYGIVPFENSTFGSVVETLDYFIHTSVKVRAETYLTVHQYLLSNTTKLENITKVYSHPQGLGQTQKWLSTHIPNAKRISVNSTAEAAQKAALETGAAAICSEICAELYGLEAIATNIEDVTANTTRFLIIGTASDSPTKDDHTLITFTVDHRQPGALCDGLKVFKDYGLNLFKIDSRPSRQRPWHYVFFVECSGHFENDDIKKALKDLEKFCLDVVILGSFPNQRPE
ncbi:Prephenate dehydratase-domain-containing protein [Cokeromyces recurvatus]|uniref:Prephenate dehydratase-domain-containing protein n=1 Tax=Cokeromyces recurvatus TaxID=90255 RepID=UPI00221F0E80|nr:Prephenate dehydratase-domain-containing protein [Cokeromyces recurvatus]KAI7905525.1 Prephenate dehydratase-domain-containing protein [Cokeromyces recurvatus]